jgi:hypothetical protein
MDEARLVAALSKYVDPRLARDLVTEFVAIRQDYATKTLGRGSPGKFVETVVQALQFLASGSFAAAPVVDHYLDRQVLTTQLPDDLKITAARIARSIYTLRNKRNISHKGAVDPNTYDLAFIHQGAAWIMAELLRNATGVPMQEAGQLVELVQAPVGTLVEEIGDTRIVHANTTIEGELLILLHSHYPAHMLLPDIYKALANRSDGAIRNKLSQMKNGKTVFGDAATGYRLTSAGYRAAIEEIRKHNP